MKNCSTRENPLYDYTADGVLITKGMTVFWARSPGQSAIVTDIRPGMSRITIDGSIEYDYPQKPEIVERKNLPANTYCIFVDQKKAFEETIAREKYLAAWLADPFYRRISKLKKQLKAIS